MSVVKLQTVDGGEVVVKMEHVEKMASVKNLLEMDIDPGAPIPLSRCTMKVMNEWVVPFAETYAADDMPDEEEAAKEKDKWVQKMFAVLLDDRDSFREVLTAANYLEYRSLFKVMTKALAQVFLDRDFNQVCGVLGVNPDEFTPEVEASINEKTFPWAFKVLDPKNFTQRKEN